MTSAKSWSALAVGSAVLLGFFLSRCHTTPKLDAPDANTDTPASASGSPAGYPARPPGKESRIAATAIKKFYPVDCNAWAALWAWAGCHDETKGFDKVLACATDSRSTAHKAQDALPAAQVSPAQSCGADIERESRSMVTLTVKYFDDLVAWVTAHRATLTGPLSTQSLHDFSSSDALGSLLTGMPHNYDEPYRGDNDVLNFGIVNHIECTKTVFRCGRDDENVCGIQKVAPSLGAACSLPSGDTTNPATWVFDRVTHERVQ